MDEDRIATLEKEMRETREAVATLRNYVLYTVGKNRILEGVVFALTETSPDGAALRQSLEKHLGPIEASIISASESEDQVTGAQQLLHELRSLIGNDA